jgi:hypothetical protein
MTSNFDKLVSEGDFDPLDSLLRMAQWPDDAPDPLDELLRLARWPEPAAESGDDWRQQMVRWQSRTHAGDVHAKSPRELAATVGRKAVRTAWVIAGSLVAVVFAALTLYSIRLVSERLSMDTITKVVPDLTPQASISTSAPHDRDFPLPEVREVLPDAALFQDTSITREELYQRMQRARYQLRTRLEDQNPVDQILTLRIAEPDGDLQELVQPLLDHRAEHERRLLERFSSFSGGRASAAMEVLSCIGSDASLPLLMQLSRQPATHVAAVRALLKLAEPRMLVRLAQNEPDYALREEIVAALRTRGDEQRLVFILAEQGEYSCLKPGLEFWQSEQ